MSIQNTEPNNSDEFIRKLFLDRCILCWRQAECVHEIKPRSSGKKSMEWKNRITLCNSCHNMGENSVHHMGTGDEMIKKLQKERMMFLVTIGRKEYV